jgi:hypothetical protein
MLLLPKAAVYHPGHGELGGTELETLQSSGKQAFGPQHTYNLSASGDMDGTLYGERRPVNGNKRGYSKEAAAMI